MGEQPAFDQLDWTDERCRQLARLRDLCEKVGSANNGSRFIQKFQDIEKLAFDLANAFFPERSFLQFLEDIAIKERQAYRDREQMQSSAVAVRTSLGLPDAVFKELCNVHMIDEHDDNGPGRVYCPLCGAAISMVWKNGRRIDDYNDIRHTDDCAYAWAQTVANSILHKG